MTESGSKITKLDSKDLQPDVELYIRQLEKENLRLQGQVAKLQVSGLFKSNKIKAMEKEISNLTKQTSNVVLYLPHNGSEGLPTHIQAPDKNFVKVFYHEEDLQKYAVKT